MLAYSPVADWIAGRLVDAPPRLRTFRALQQSRLKLAIGIAVAWLLGGFLEEAALRGIVLASVEGVLASPLGEMVATAAAVLVAALAAAVLHAYQGPRAMIIIGQLSVLFGVLYAMSGPNLWTVILCHGLYDTVAFARFANKSSKYSRLD
ncbi:MAG: CPBP family intramembrane metalloprotease [Hyphomicrobiaceae bacterium]|nr:CPBP family intramembrane metalloprotease [Hyphomicrobiaceae bacterium]